MNRIRCVFAWSLLVFSLANRPRLGSTETPQGSDSTSTVAVGPQSDTTHVYVAPENVDAFVKAFLGTFGGTSTKQVVVTVTPTPSSTSSQLLQTPVGTVSLFGFKTPVPYPFGGERTGYLVTDLDGAIESAKSAGADVLVAPFPDPIGRDAVIQWPGGINMQVYWHTTKPSYVAFQTIPENRVYVSPVRVNDFLRSFLTRPELRLADQATHSGASSSNLSSASSRSLLPMAISPTPMVGKWLAMRFQA